MSSSETSSTYDEHDRVIRACEDAMCVYEELHRRLDVVQEKIDKQDKSCQDHYKSWDRMIQV